MSTQQTPRAAMEPDGRGFSLRGTVRWILGIALAAGGGGAALSPFLSPTRSWTWSLQEKEDLADAQINAQLVSIDGAGARLVRQGSRHVSIISPPLNLPADTGRVLEAEVARPEIPVGQPRRTRVRFLWQTDAMGDRFQHTSREVDLNRDRLTVRFSLPSEASALFRIGLQFPDVGDAVQVNRLSLPSLSPVRRAGLAWDQCLALEPIDNARINFLRGPRILGRGLNYYLVSVIVTCLGIHALFQTRRRRSLSRGFIIGVILVGWFVADAWATWNLTRHASGEISAFRDSSPANRIALANGPEVAWAFSQMSQHAEPGATYAVVSDDPFGPAHRLDYLLAPTRIRRASYREASYVVVVRAGDATYDASDRRFRRGDGPWVSAEWIASLSPDVYLLKRIGR